MLIAGCNGAQPSLGLPPSTSQFHASRTNDRPALQSLLYVSDLATGSVYVRALPKGNLVGTLSGFGEPEGMCADRKGDVFITDYEIGVIREYAHGGQNPIAMLNDTGFHPYDCSVDPVTGDLAVTNLTDEGNRIRGILATYAKAQGAARYRYDRGIGFAYCSYDDKGDLFLDGVGPPPNAPAYAELRRGASTFTTITVAQTITSPGGIRWDGKYFSVGERAANVVYRIKIVGSRGIEAGATTLAGSNEIGPLWIAGSTIYVPQYTSKENQAEVRFYHYPAGGKALNTLFGFSVPGGVTVSAASAQ